MRHSILEKLHAHFAVCFAAHEVQKQSGSLGRSQHPLHGTETKQAPDEPIRDKERLSHGSSLRCAERLEGGGQFPAVLQHGCTFAQIRVQHTFACRIKAPYPGVAAHTLPKRRQGPPLE